MSARWCAVRVRLWCIRAAVRSFFRWHMPVRYGTVAAIIDGETERIDQRIDYLFSVMAVASEYMGDTASAERCRRQGRRTAHPGQERVDGLERRLDAYERGLIAVLEHARVGPGALEKAVPGQQELRRHGLHAVKGGAS